MASRFAPDMSTFRQTSEEAGDKAYDRVLQAQNLAKVESKKQEANVAEKEKWMKIKNAVVSSGKTLQNTINKQLESNMMKYSIPQGKFTIEDETVQWKWNENATTKKLPTMEEGWSIYKKSKILSGQVPDFGAYYAMHNRMNSAYATFLGNKLQSVAGLGYDADDVRGALSDNDLLSNIAQVSTAQISSPDGKSTQSAGAIFGPWLQPMYGKEKNILGQFWEESGGVGPIGAGIAGTGVTGLKAARQAGLVKGTEKYIARGTKKGAAAILKAGLSKFKTAGKTATDAVTVLKDVGTYAGKHGYDDVVKQLMKKGIKKRLAKQIATRAIASASALAVGGMATAFTSGLSTVLGVAGAAYGIYDILGALQEIHPEIKQKLYGDASSLEF